MNWDQLKAILGLRLQLSRNQWARSKFGIGGVIAFLLAAAAIIVTASGLLGGFWAGRALLGHAASDTITRVWLILFAVFLFFWLMGLVIELQRSESIDLQRLMHLPVKLGQVFALNYVASHFVLSITVVVPIAIGLTLGLAIARGPIMLLQLPLSFAVILMITSWTYWLKGWIAALVVDPRRRRSVMALVTLAIVVFAQLPNLYFNVFNRSSRRHPRTFLTPEVLRWQKYFPPFWASVGAGNLANHNPLPAIAGAAGGFALAAFGLFRSYRATLNFYHGNDLSSSTSATLPASSCASPASVKFVEARLPFLSEESSAVAVATLRAILRAPEIKMAWGMSIVVTVFLAATTFMRLRSGLPAAFKPFLVPSVLSFSMLTLSQFLTNQFGYDREGFQSYVMSPIDRRSILIGKNVAALPVICFSGLLWLLLAWFFVDVPLLTAAAAVFQIATAALVAITFGNWVSIYVPYRIRVGSLKPTKVSGAGGLLIALCTLVLPITLLPIFLAPAAETFLHLEGIASSFPINLLLSILITLIAALCYWWLLLSLGLALQRRETKILETLTSEIE